MADFNYTSPVGPPPEDGADIVRVTIDRQGRLRVILGYKNSAGQVVRESREIPLLNTDGTPATLGATVRGNLRNFVSARIVDSLAAAGEPALPGGTWTP